jgi:hypothetical protein
MTAGLVTDATEPRQAANRPHWAKMRSLGLLDDVSAWIFWGPLNGFVLKHAERARLRAKPEESVVVEMAHRQEERAVRPPE